MSKKYLAYTLLICTTLIWSVNFIIGKFAYLFEVPPLSLNFLRWALVWIILFPFTYREIFLNIKLIKKNIIYLTILAITSVSAFNSLVYLSLNYTQAIDTILMISITPVFVLFLSSILGIEKFKFIQFIGLIVSFTGVLIIFSHADLNKIINLNFNRGNGWMLLAVFSWALYSSLLKKKKLPFSTLGLVEILASIGLIFLIPQFIGEQMYGKEIKFNKAFFLILSFVTFFASIGAYYSWNKAIGIIGPNRASIFLHLMPVFGVILAIVLLKEKFQIYHFIGAGFIVTGIYLSNRKYQ
ncbi:MAG: DMT family transporter [Pelagibacteraceae bacterium]|nr:DMT family transporter [Pelagibacteraceae bacterium]